MVRIEGEPILRRTAFQAEVWRLLSIMARIGVQMVQGVQKVQGVQLRPIRGRKKEGELLDGDVGKERLNESAGMSDFLL